MTKKLTRTDTVGADDLIVLFQNTNQDYRAGPMAKLVEYLNTALTFPAPVGQITKQLVSPNASGFNVAVTNTVDTWLIMTPTTALSAGTITLPAAPTDLQEVSINSTNSIAALTVSGNSKTVRGAPGALGADDFFILRYESTLQTWYRIA